MDDKLQELYKSALMRHSRTPHGVGKLENPSHEHFITNPLCGDEIHLYLEIADSSITSAAFESQSCSICQASASILMETIQPGKGIEETADTATQLIQALQEKDSPSPYPSSDDRSALFGVKAFASRIRCATLPWEAFLAAITGPAKH